jgi:hypothetical protein
MKQEESLFNALKQITWNQAEELQGQCLVLHKLIYLYDGNAESRHFFWGRPQMVIQQTLGWIMFGGLLTLGHYPW